LGSCARSTAELERVKAQKAKLVAELAAIEAKEAELKAKMPKYPPAVPVPKTTCVICCCDFGDDDKAQDEGLMCAAEIGFGHFVCSECLQVGVRLIPATVQCDDAGSLSRGQTVERDK
jgi:hypothetical protein